GRTKAYDIVQRNAMQAWKEGTDFKEELLSDKEFCHFILRRELDKIFDLDYYLRNINKIFKKVGL
ncbi:MAG: adenylosuccinate lyase, partial [bacterium]